MLKLISLLLTSLVLCQSISPSSAYLLTAADSIPVPPPKPTDKCPTNLAKTCTTWCLKNSYVLDANGCPTCACYNRTATGGIFRAPKGCPLMKCAADCGDAGYKIDGNGCRTCNCASTAVKEVLPKPVADADDCSPMRCDLNCKYGFERDPVGCELCSCNRCPLQRCRMFCMYGFKKNSDGCDVCECDWTPIAENIACSERIPCPGRRVCNSNLNFCELVSDDRVVWFLYDFNIKSDLFDDPRFVQLFKNDLINNIASKYDLELGQITVSSVEQNGMTSFQVMPFYVENMGEFQKKMDQIDADLTSNEFRTVLPMVSRKTGQTSKESKWTRFLRRNPHLGLYTTAVAIGLIALLFAGVFIAIFRRRIRFPGRSDSKVPIFETSYHPAPTEDDHYHAVHAPDGTAYVVVESEDAQASNDRRALV